MTSTAGTATGPAPRPAKILSGFRRLPVGACDWTSVAAAGTVVSTTIFPSSRSTSSSRAVSFSMSSAKSECIKVATSASLIGVLSRS